MKKTTFGLLTFYCAATACCCAARAVPLSQYGQIQNVQNYSTNPFWSPGQQYNKRIMPSPVYVTGPEVDTQDCQTIVTNLVASQCAANNNCNGMRVADVRPAIMLELSRMPGHNYASSCAGYIDTAFDTYVKQYANVVQPSAFPAATGAANIQQQNEFKINNPYASKVPDWANDVKERAIELQQLQSQNGAGTEHIAKAAFPTTINDVSFADRMENLAAGYAPYKDAKAYNGIKVESEEKALTRQLETLEARRQIDAIQMSNDEYCDKYFDETRCPQDRGREQEIIAIGDNPAKQNQGGQSGTQPSQNPTANTPAQQNTPTIAMAPATTPTTGPEPVTAAPAAVPNRSSAPATVMANNRVHDGPCTPSTRSNVFKNKILTTGKYEQIDPAFEKMMVQIFRVEGDCGSHPNDPGGYTCYGYAQNYNRDIDVRKLTRGGAEDRTYERFYKAKGIDKLPDSIRGDVLRGDFASGPGAGVKKLQKTLGLKETGKVDSELIQAAENFNGDLHNAYWDTLQRYYVSITEHNPKRKVFLKGWMNGVKLMRENGCHVEPSQPLTR